MTELPVRHIYRWDLDKTYLQTDFDTFRDLVRTAFQKAEEKYTVPGADALLRELLRNQNESRVLLTFISGSPRQMRDVLEEKFALDGIHPDAFILKPTLRNILKGRFKAIKGQIGYKLEALLRIRAESPDAPETLFGDDSEQDAFIYSLYIDLIRGRIGHELLRAILVESEVYASPMARILELSKKISTSEKIGRIFIHLDRKSPPGRFRVFGSRLVPISNYFQAALILYSDDVLSLEGVLNIAEFMIANHEYDLHKLANSFQDLIRRRHLGTPTIDRLSSQRDMLNHTFKTDPEFLDQFIRRVRSLAPLRSDEKPPRDDIPDYIEILRSDRAMKKALASKEKAF